MTSFSPVNIKENDPCIIANMKKAAYKASVGPMAAVAGAIANNVLKNVLKKVQFTGINEIIIENGGDIALYIEKPIFISIFSGSKEFKNKTGFVFDKIGKIYGISTSSAKIGHSKSFGNTDSVTCVSESPDLADAFATGIGNIVKSSNDFKKLEKIDFEKKGINQIIVFIKDKVFIKGEFEIKFY